ncbi:15684_t:CDS:2 [Racocetra fulgida]|uniref:15684_t:CDS:1 n=1 Tax=Racocetra fulgida TaxID=60492 RepID=A0A9N9IHS8_9GLOM|nr:15684_t:CDS:2 [Racocetra fulgida]
MLEEEALSASFFESSKFQPSVSASPEIPEVSQSASFTTDSLNNINPWDPPQHDISTILNLNSFSASHPPPMPLQADDPWAMPATNMSNPTYPQQTNFPINNNINAPAIITTLPSEDEFQWFYDMDHITVNIAPERDDNQLKFNNNSTLHLNDISDILQGQVISHIIDCHAFEIIND